MKYLPSSNFDPLRLEIVKDSNYRSSSANLQVGKVDLSPPQVGVRTTVDQSLNLDLFETRCAGSYILVESSSLKSYFN